MILLLVNKKNILRRSSNTARKSISDDGLCHSTECASHRCRSFQSCDSSQTIFETTASLTSWYQCSYGQLILQHTLLPHLNKFKIHISLPALHRDTYCFETCFSRQCLPAELRKSGVYKSGVMYRLGQSRSPSLIHPAIPRRSIFATE